MYVCVYMKNIYIYIYTHIQIYTYNYAYTYGAAPVEGLRLEVDGGVHALRLLVLRRIKYAQLGE